MESKKQQNIIKHNLKDSVFTNLFSRSEYLLELYKTLHPEDLDVTEDDLTTVTINNLITNDIYNDLGFTVRGTSIHLIEAQSTWTPNIVYRELEYIVKSYRIYLEKTVQNKYSMTPIKLPRPELYVIYTGDKKGKPEYLYLKDLFASNTGFSSIDLSVKILYYEGGTDIVNQYAAFAKIYDEQRKLFDDRRLAVKETIRICKNADILKKYLEEHESEVEDIMLGFYDPEEEMREYVRCEVAQASKKAAAEAMAVGEAKGLAEGLAKGEAKGLATGLTEGLADAVSVLMKKLNIPQEQAMEMLDITGTDAEKVSVLLAERA